MTFFSPYSREQIRAVLEIPQPTLILMHRGPDGDAVGSAFALKEMLEQLGSPCYCLCSGEIPDRLRFLTFGQTSVLQENIPDGFQDARAICVDVASPQQLGDLQEVYSPRISLMIDHHGNGTPFANNLVVPSASAAGEIVFELAKDWEKEGKISFTASLAERLYGAITSDTGCFRHANTTPLTHRIAAELLEYGIDTASVNQKLFGTHTLEELKAVSAGISRLQVFKDGKLAVISFPYTLKRDLGLQDCHLETLVDYARTLKDVEVGACIRQPGEEGIFRISLRSNTDFNVAEIASSFGGGGHVRAAGCTVEAETIEKAIELLCDKFSF